MTMTDTELAGLIRDNPEQGLDWLRHTLDEWPVAML